MNSIIPIFSNIQDPQERKQVKLTFISVALILMLQIVFDVYMDIFCLNISGINPVMIVFAVFTLIFSGLIFAISKYRLENNSTANIGQLIFGVVIMIAVVTQASIVGSKKGAVLTNVQMATMTLTSLIMAVIIICSSVAHIGLLMKQVVDITVNCHERCAPPKPQVSEYETFQTPPEQP